MAQGRSDNPGGDGQSSLKLPPLVRDHPVRTETPPLNRTLHQIQLEMEYNVEETENEVNKSGLALPSLAGESARLAAVPPDNLGEMEKDIHALCVFDPITIPKSAYSRTLITDALKDMPVRRKWGRWRWRWPPDLSSMRVVEAVMVYERGIECQPERRCSRCRAGEGYSPQCVVPSQTAAGHGVGPCSNCLYDGWGSNCSVSAGSASGRDEDAVVDHMAVLDLIAGLKRPSGTTRDHSLQTKARRIETAALHIAQAAREWGGKMAREN